MKIALAVIVLGCIGMRSDVNNRSMLNGSSDRVALHGDWRHQHQT